MAQKCSVCVDSKRRPAIDAMLTQGATLTDTAARFGLVIESLRRHRKNHLGIAGPHAVAKAKRESVPIVPVSVVKSAESVPVEPIVVEPVSLRSADDVLGALEWSVAETKELLQRAKAAGDLRLQNQLLQTAIGALDKLAKSVGLYTDGAVINVDASTKRLELAVGRLTDDQLDAILTGKTVPALEGGTDG